MHSRRNVYDFYDFGQNIGKGEFGIVRIATARDSDKAVTYAVKSVRKACLEPYQRKLIQRELEVLCQVNHPNIVRVFEVYEDSEFFHIVMEHCTGGELFAALLERGRLSEAEAASILTSLLHALVHLHNKSVSHRDLKPENILFASSQPDSAIKLADFGFAKKMVSPLKKEQTIVGTPYYIAPEVLGQRYGVSCDVWSAGVILYMLLIGQPPFPGKNSQEILSKVKTAQFSEEGDEWTNLSHLAKDLLVKMLCKDPVARITAAEALEHPWFINLRHSSGAQTQVLHRLQAREHLNKLQREALSVLVRHLPQDEVKELGEVFCELDTNHTGLITEEELLSAFEGANLNVSAKEFQTIMQSIDQTGTGAIDYDEFLAATVDQDLLADRRSLRKVFDQFDTASTGVLTRASLRKALRNAGWTMSGAELEGILGTAQDIDFEAFCNSVNFV